MKTILAGVLAVAATAALADTAIAQIPNVTPFSVEVRAGVALPSGDFGDEDALGVDLQTGVSLSGSVAYHFMPGLAVYGGYSYNRFGVDDAEDVDVIDRGFDAGLRFGIPTPLIPIDPWIKGGLVYHEIELDGDGGSISTDSELGFEVGAGLGFAIFPKVTLTPGISYTSYSMSGDDFDEGEDFDVSHIKVDVGVRIRL